MANMDMIEYGLQEGYMIQKENQIFINPNSTLDYNTFNFMYKNYCKKSCNPERR